MELKIASEGFADNVKALANKVKATYDYYDGKTHNKLANLEKATLADIDSNSDLKDIVSQFDKYSKDNYKVEVDRSAGKALLTYSATAVPSNIVDDMRPDGKYYDMINDYDSDTQEVHMIFDINSNDNTEDISDELTDSLKLSLKIDESTMAPTPVPYDAEDHTVDDDGEVLSKKAKESSTEECIEESAPAIEAPDESNAVSVVDIIKNAYDEGKFGKLPCVGRQNACQIDISGVDKDRLISFFDKKKEFNREDHNEAGVNSVEFISDKFDVEVFDSFIQIYIIPQYESLKRMTIDEFSDTVNKDEESLSESKSTSLKSTHICAGCGKPIGECTCDVEEDESKVDEALGIEEEFSSTSATQSSSIGQHKVDSIDLIEDVDNWTELDHKSVPDSDGFDTDYTLYTDGQKFVCIFGDKEIYLPDDGEFDYETENEEDAREWFKNCTGIGDDNV